MKIKAKIIRHKKNEAWIKKGDIQDIKKGTIEFCCDQMRVVWDEESCFVGFGEFDSLLNKDANVNIYSCKPYPEGACWDKMPIQACPFCREKIEIILEEEK